MTNEELAKAFYIYKVTLDKCAREAGGSMNFFSQHSVLWGVQAQQNHKLAENNNAGVCAGLSIEWVKATLAGKDFLAAMGEARNNIVASGSLGDDASSFLTSVDQSHLLQGSRVSEAFDGVGVLKATNSYDYPFNGGLKSMKKGYFYYIGTGSKSSASAGGHAMAAFCHGSKIDFYDPNVGVVMGAKKDLVAKYMKEAVRLTVVDIQKKSVGDCNDKILKFVEFKPL